VNFGLGRPREATVPSAVDGDRFDTPEHRGDTRRLALWLTLVGLLIGLGYLATFTTSSKATNGFYEYSTAEVGGFLYVVWFALVLWITGSSRELLALRPPASWGRALGLAGAVLLGSLIVIDLLLDPILHGAREQGAVPTHWLPAHAGAYAANWVVVAVVAPFVEEITYRGLGYSLLVRRIGTWLAILAIGLLFAASHGLVQAFPELAALGCALAWLRSRTQSVYPGMLVHAIFNSIAMASVLFASH
jgi:membrane protease YdiL (CAAX protease family)